MGHFEEHVTNVTDRYTALVVQLDKSLFLPMIYISRKIGTFHIK